MYIVYIIYYDMTTAPYDTRKKTGRYGQTWPKNGQAWSDMAGVLDMWQITFKSLQNMSTCRVEWTFLDATQHLWISVDQVDATCGPKICQVARAMVHDDSAWGVMSSGEVFRSHLNSQRILNRVDNRQILK